MACTYLPVSLRLTLRASRGELTGIHWTGMPNTVRLRGGLARSLTSTQISVKSTGAYPPPTGIVAPIPSPQSAFSPAFTARRYVPQCYFSALMRLRVNVNAEADRMPGL
ncbi:hypothetical protein FA95DRAFT_129154 [Auriscalpium vulgare]|uniref:Uncharacterized protein n=1 Tax=Auriscalpium vulgare TaxID=40419 RepID=A0ACB8RN62_9AGAM|nr:hypothetical protein FA95DRAFT_129154 [Auriscalpium vulgare]